VAPMPMGVSVVQRFGVTYYYVPPYTCPECDERIEGEYVGYYLSLAAAAESLRRGQNQPCFRCLMRNAREHVPRL